MYRGAFRRLRLLMHWTRPQSLQRMSLSAPDTYLDLQHKPLDSFADANL